MIDVTVPADKNISFKEFQKVSKYKVLKLRLKNVKTQNQNNSTCNWSHSHDKVGYTKFYLSNP